MHQRYRSVRRRRALRPARKIFAEGLLHSKYFFASGASLIPKHQPAFRTLTIRINFPAHNLHERGLRMYSGRL